MRIAVYIPKGVPESFRVCIDGLVPELSTLGCKVVGFGEPDEVPADVDVIWDPRAGGGNPPLQSLCRRAQPLVVTLHGVAPMAIPLREYFPTWRSRLDGFLANRRKKAEWKALAGGYAAVIAVSSYSRKSSLKALPIPPELIFHCDNAVNHQSFKSAASSSSAGNYFLHISNDEPRKNVDRICEAYLGLPRESRPPLYLKLPKDSPRVGRQGIEVIRARLSEDELVELYRNASAFLFPSLYEGFGLPILEAMACGCPVITANDNACAEVADSAALTVDPRSVDEIREAMQRFIDDEALRPRLKEAGLHRASYFSWAKSASCYQHVFQFAIDTWSASR